MFDSLNRNYLSSYGNNSDLTPNFLRLTSKAATFENCFIGSAPCMPARREMHTGRYNFLHRSWGPVEPFDFSVFEALKNNGIHTHLITDHFHYWEDGGSTYHNRYSSWEIIRGQQVDPWKVDLSIEVPKNSLNSYDSPVRIFDRMNRRYTVEKEVMPGIETFDNGIDFLETNFKKDNWLVQIEAFDPHEPFIVPSRYYHKAGVPEPDVEFDWPEYGPVMNSQAEVEVCRNNYLALLAMCDEQLGRILDFMDEKQMWSDTMLIVNTDHGFFLGERGLWGKVTMPYYNQISKIPLFLWDPQYQNAGKRVQSLVQTIDIAPTLLEAFRIPIPSVVLGRPLQEQFANKKDNDRVVLFGSFGGHINCCDGRYVYMRAPVDPHAPLYNYSLMPTHMRGFFSSQELATMELGQFFNYTGGTPMFRTLGTPFQKVNAYEVGDLLFDLETDPEQLLSLNNKKIAKNLLKKMRNEMLLNEAPKEMYVRYGIEEA